MGELREYTTLTGKVMENSLKMINLERMLPESIRRMLQTVEIKDYTKAKEYAIKQVRALKREKDPKNKTLDLNEDEDEKKKVTFEEPPNLDAVYTNEDWLCYIGKGAGKGGKGTGQKGGKGGFQGNCHYGGVFGHRINECRKKDVSFPTIYLTRETQKR